MHPHACPQTKRAILKTLRRYNSVSFRCLCGVSGRCFDHGTALAPNGTEDIVLQRALVPTKKMGARNPGLPFTRRDCYSRRARHGNGSNDANDGLLCRSVDWMRNWRKGTRRVSPPLSEVSLPARKKSTSGTSMNTPTLSTVRNRALLLLTVDSPSDDQVAVRLTRHSTCRINETPLILS